MKILKDKAMLLYSLVLALFLSREEGSLPPPKTISRNIITSEAFHPESGKDYPRRRRS